MPICHHYARLEKNRQAAIKAKKTVSSSSAVHIGKICWSSTPNEAIIFGLSVRGMRAGQKEKIMKRAIRKRADPEMRVEYDFSRGVRGKYARRYAQGTNV